MLYRPYVSTRDENMALGNSNGQMADQYRRAVRSYFGQWKDPRLLSAHNQENSTPLPKPLMALHIKLVDDESKNVATNSNVFSYNVSYPCRNAGNGVYVN
eukprot:3045019-Amphidinium_carterae.1